MENHFRLRFFSIVLLLTTRVTIEASAQLLEANRAKISDFKPKDEKNLRLDPVNFNPRIDSTISIPRNTSKDIKIEDLKEELEDIKGRLLQIGGRTEVEIKAKMKELARELEKKELELVELKNSNDKDFQSITILLTEKHNSNLKYHTKVIKEFYESLTRLKSQLAVDMLEPDENKQFDIQRFLDSAYFSLSTINDSLLLRLKEVKKLSTSYEREIVRLSNSKLRSELSTTEIDKLNAVLSNNLESFGKDFKLFSAEVRTADSRIKAKRELYKERTKNTDFGAIPGLAAVFGQREVVPNITLLGSRKFENKSNKDNSQYGELRFFTGAVATNKDVTRASSLFIVETSSFGFTSNFTYGFVGYQKGKVNDTKKVAINVSMNFLGKNLQSDTVTNFSVSMFHGKLGGEYLFVNKGSIYFNWCGLLIIDEVKKFGEHFNNDTQIKTFSEIGARFYLDLSSDANLSLKVDLNFIYQNERVKELTQNQDVFIPNIRIGLVRKIDN
ncbi:MAG: hypothetical protein J0L66_07315 [Cytophagales bacterium]|nr:hypothetical protein [Cytophagales bacterium]